jgi:hypothetical protein
MSHKLSVIFLLFSVFLSSSANAGFTSPATIEGYDIGNHGKLIIRLSVSNTCTPASNLFVVSNTEPYFDSMLSTVMSAYIAKKEIQVWAGDCGTDNLDKIVRIMVGRVW